MADFRLENNTWEEARDLIETSRGTGIITIGSIEQHGYHLPLGTDSFVANSLGLEGSRRTGAVLIPPLWFGWCPHHMALPGSISIRPRVLEDLVYDIIESLSSHGLNKFVVINGHRIVNIVWLQIMAEKAQRELGVKICLFDPAYMSKDLVAKLGFGPLGHGDEIESSHMAYIEEDLVKLDRALDLKLEEETLYSPDPAYIHDTLCYVPSTLEATLASVDQGGGSHGEPSKASREKGKIYHEHLVKNLVRVIEDLQELAYEK